MVEASEDGTGGDLNMAIDEAYDWLCEEAAPDVRPRLHQAFSPDPGVRADALEAMVARDWLRRQDNGQLALTSKGLTELGRRRPDLRGV